MVFFRHTLAFFTLLQALTQVSVPVFAAPTSAASSTVEKRSISQSLYDDLVRYTKYSSAAHQHSCPRPLGNTGFYRQFADAITDTQGFIARDDMRKEIVISFRGSTSAIDFLNDIRFNLVPFSSPSLPPTFATTASSAKVHAGFLRAFNSVASLIVNTVSAQLAANPTYSIVSTGHSLGGALASINGVVLKANFPNVPLKAYMFGQPRTGDKPYADLVDSVIGVENLFRAVHLNDLFTTIPPQGLGYQHHGTEYWNFREPASPSTVKQCTGQEDPTCSKRRLPTVIDTVFTHIYYFGQVIALESASICAGK